jgi:hypothetical protein
MLLLAPLLACRGEPDAATESPGPSDTSDTSDTRDTSDTSTPVSPALAVADALPARAPGITLLAVQTSEGAVEVEGTVTGTQTVDLDDPADARDAFRYQVLDAAGAVIYERTTPGPAIVKAFLDYYGDATGYDVLALYPQLGTFAITVPLLDDGVSVRFQLRDTSGMYQDAGEWELARAEAEDVGLSDVVTGHETLWEGGPSDTRVDVVLVGDGYTAEQQGEWVEEAGELAEAILATEPFAARADLLNVHRVDAVSAESGVSYDCDGCGFRDTAFGTIYPLGLVNALLGTDYRGSAVFQVEQHEVARAVSVVPWDFVVVVANTDAGGGMAVHYATVPSNGREWTKTGVHELAHVFGLLGDEYESYDCIVDPALGLPENIADTPEDLPWEAWVDPQTPLPTPEEDAFDDVVGAFAGAYNCPDLYRPARACLMNDHDDPFCPVCTGLLARRFFRWVDPVDDVALASQPDGTVTLTPEGRVGWTGAWAVDGAVVSTDPTLTLDLAAYGAGDHTLALDATWPDPDVRGDASALGQRYTWSWTAP